MPADGVVIVTDGPGLSPLRDRGFSAITLGSPNFERLHIGRRVAVWGTLTGPLADVPATLAGIAAEVRVVRAALPPAEYFAAGHDTADAERLLAAAPAWTAAADAPHPYQLFTAADLASRPQQEWLVADAVPYNGIVGFIGPKGTYKTFAVLYLALCIVTGTPWHGRAVKRGGIVYVYAEGAFGALARVEAWIAQQAASGVTVDRDTLPIWFLPRRLPVNSAADVAALLAEIRARTAINGDIGELAPPPLAVIIDTVNQNLDGDEDGRGMSGFVAGCCALRDALGCTVMVVHHTPLGDEGRARGHSALDGALDTRFIISRDNERLTIECGHQRNGVDGWAVAFEAVKIAGSLALKPSALDGGQLEGQRRELLRVLHGLGTATYTTWKNTSEISASSFRKALRWLAAKAYVKQEGRNYSATASGVAALGHQGHQEGHHG